MPRKLFLNSTVLLICLTLCTCKKDNPICPDEQAFCSLVSDGNFEATGEVIDDFLRKQDNGDAESNLNELRDWLQCKSCVEMASVFCNSCIETYPEQSELRVHFVSNGQTVELTMDILMSEPMRFLRYHE